MVAGQLAAELLLLHCRAHYILVISKKNTYAFLFAFLSFVSSFYIIFYKTFKTNQFAEME